MFDPIGMLLGGIIVEKIMRGDYVGYAAARSSFVTHMQSSTFRPYHLWVVMSWTGLVWGSTREIDGLADLLTWVQNTVPERFRGTGLPETRRMRVTFFNVLYSSLQFFFNVLFFSSFAASLCTAISVLRATVRNLSLCMTAAAAAAASSAIATVVYC
jgi:hypothetical protein